MAPVTHADRYRESIDFWRDVYGINSKSTVHDPLVNFQAKSHSIDFNRNELICTNCKK